MVDRSFLDIPESDYQSDEPVVNAIEVTMSYDDPNNKEQPNKFKPGETYTAHYYGVEYNGAEYTMSASEALHKLIQGTGATKGSVVRIIKKRIGQDNKDIRWSASLVGGPVDQNKVGGVGQTSGPKESIRPALPQQPPSQPAYINGSGVAQGKVYESLKDNEDYVALSSALAQDKLALWVMVFDKVTEQYPDETSEWRAVRATHINIGLEKDLYHKWEKERWTVPPPPVELEPREQAIMDTDLQGFVAAVANGHENLNSKVAGATVQKFGYKTLPRDDKEVWLTAAKLAWRYQDRIDQGMDEYYAMTGTADEFEVPYEICTIPPDPNAEPEKVTAEDDEIPF